MTRAGRRPSTRPAPALRSWWTGLLLAVLVVALANARLPTASGVEADPDRYAGGRHSQSRTVTPGPSGGTGLAPGESAVAPGPTPGEDRGWPVDRAGEPGVRGSSWGWPVGAVPRVLRGFDPPDQRWGAGHRGVDVAGAAGEPVLAVDDGAVTYSGVINGTGVITVQHDVGLRSTYQPVDDRLATGAVVERGAAIGVLGSQGRHCRVQACLHLGAVLGRETYLDPLLLLQPWRLSLLPLGAPPGQQERVARAGPGAPGRGSGLVSAPVRVHRLSGQALGWAWR